MRSVFFAAALFALALAGAGTVPAQPEVGPLVFPPEKGEALILTADVIDGDTVRLYFLVEATARLDGINAPEKRTKAGKAARDYLAGLLPKAPTRAVLKGREKYGRLLVRLDDAGGRDVSKLMIDAGHAKAWDGKGPRP